MSKHGVVVSEKGREPSPMVAYVVWRSAPGVRQYLGKGDGLTVPENEPMWAHPDSPPDASLYRGERGARIAIRAALKKGWSRGDDWLRYGWHAPR